jgi:hypothetical protein
VKQDPFTLKGWVRFQASQLLLALTEEMLTQFIEQRRKENQCCVPGHQGENPNHTLLRKMP